VAVGPPAWPDPEKQIQEECVMERMWFTASLWLILAVAAAVAGRWLRIATALSEILTGIVAAWLLALVGGEGLLSASGVWVTFLAAAGSVLLTFLAGAELDPAVLRANWRETVLVGAAGFLGPFFGVTLIAHNVAGWAWRPSWLAGVALSTTSVAVVYAVMLELGLNRTDFGKAILGACFVNDVGTVLALGLIFAPFTVRTLIFAAAGSLAVAVTPLVTPWLFRRFAHRASEVETKYLLLLLFSAGGLAVWAGSEAVLPAYLLGMALAGSVGRDHALIRRLRTLTLGFLTPFYFIRAGALVSLPAVVGAPLTFATLFAAKMLSKLTAVFPAVKGFKYEREETMYYTLMMSTGLTFGTISALFGLGHGIIDRAQYSCLVAVVIASAVIPTAIANAWFLPARFRQAPPEPVARGAAVFEEPA
jgi:Kef-type K+ transport system membrane component KefB